MFSRLVLFSLYLTYVVGCYAEASDRACHQKILKAICLVDSPDKEKDRYKDHRVCLPGEQKYYQLIIDAYNTFPEFVQKTVCSLRKIYIEKDFFGSAWSALDDDNNPNSGLIGLRQKDLDSQLNIQTYNTWFEQQSFGGPNNFHVSQSLPQIIVIPKHKQNMNFLSYTLLHEIGHILDYQHRFNRVDCTTNGDSCKAEQGSWTSLSWINLETPKAENNFAERKNICLNSCKEQFLTMDTADRFYKKLYTHGYISQLSAVNAMEDWAESFTVYVSKKYMNIHYAIVLPTGKKYQSNDVINSYKFFPKKKYLEKAIKLIDVSSHTSDTKSSPKEASTQEV